MTNEPHASHVLIRGHVFTYDEKAPFVTSGMSVLGALEYDEATDKTKCHECGEWAAGLAHHVRIRHSLDRADYNAKHGLRKSSALSGMRTREHHRQSSLKPHNIARATEMAAARAAANRGRPRPSGPQYEVSNENNRCRAQIVFRLMTLAVQVGHTPTVKERVAAGLLDSMVNRRFGNISNAMRAAELEPNHGQSITPLHREYPQSAEEIRARMEKWESPMPWPKEYFSVDIMALEQRRGSN